MLFKVRRLTALTTVCLLALSATPVLAAAPDNDDIGGPTVIGAIPYTNEQDTTEATTGPGDPEVCFGSADAATVWYEFTPAESVRLEANTFGSEYDTTLYVGVADGEGGIDVIDCNDDTFDLQSRVRFDADAGITYLFVVGTCCGSSGEPGGGWLVFNLDIAPPVVPLELEVTLDTRGSFDKAGTATLRGMVTCSGADGVELYAYLRQSVGRVFTVQGDGFAFVECSPDGIPWEIQVWPYSGKFAGGSAEAYVDFFTCGDEDCIGDFIQSSVRLRR